MAEETSNIIDKIASIRSVSSTYLHEIAYNDKQYNSAIDFILDVLRTFPGVTEVSITNEILSTVFGKAITQKIEKGKENIEAAVFDVVNEWDENDVGGWLLGLEDAIKVTIANILTGIFSCSVNPYLPKYAMDNGGSERYYGDGILIPISILDYSGVLGVAPLGTTGQYFYDIIPKSNYYEKVFRSDVETKEVVTGYETEYMYLRVSDSEASVLKKNETGVLIPAVSADLLLDDLKQKKHRKQRK